MTKDEMIKYLETKCHALEARLDQYEKKILELQGCTAIDCD